VVGASCATVLAMGRTLTVSLVLAASCVFSCSKPEGVVAETLVPPPPRGSASKLDVHDPPPPSPQAPVRDDAPLPPPKPLAIAQTEAAAPALGSACGAEASLCGTRGRVSVRAYRSHGFHPRPDAPCTTVSTATGRIADSPEMPSACASDDRLVVDTSCVVCRMPQGTFVEAVISELTPQQVSSLVKFAGLAAGSAPRSSADWRSAIAEAHKRSPYVQQP
jgi:hypothetical protein